MKKTCGQWIKEKAARPNGLFFLALAAAVLQAAAAVVFALSVKELINTALSAESVEIIIVKTVLSAVFAALIYLLSCLSRIIGEKCRIETEANLKTAIFSSLLSKNYAGVSAYKSGELLNRITTDSQIVANGYVTVPISATAIISKIIFAVAALLFYQPIFTLILASVGVIVALLSVAFRKITKKLYRASREADGKVFSFLNEGVNNMLAVKVFSAEKKLSDKGREIVGDAVKVVEKQKFITAGLNSALSLGFMLMYLLTICYGALGLFNGWAGIDFGMITAMLQLVSQLQAPFASVGAIFTLRYEMLASTDRLMEIDAIENEKTVEKMRFDFSKIVAKDLTFSYDRENVLLGGGFSIEKGEFALIGGASGIGKSTLLKLMLGVYDNYGGKLYFEGSRDKAEIELSAKTRNMFCYVPQGNLLFSGSIRQNICFMNENASEEDVNRAVRLAALSEFVASLKDGLDTIVGEKGVGLSEGQGQRVAIARAICSNRPIILLDEATSALDAETEELVLKNISELKSELTVVVISHRLAVEKYCDKIIKIDGGKFTEK